MGRREFPICCWCKHYKGTNMVNGIHQETCTAFAEGIPDEIIPQEIGDMALFDHRYSHSDDGGIQFEREDDYDKLKKRFPISMIMKGYTEKDKERAYQYLYSLFDKYDKRHEAGVMQPEVQTKPI